MKLTAPLLIIFLTAIFLFLAATNIQGGWLYLVDALLWTVLVLALLLPLLQLRRLLLVRRLPPLAYAKQKLKVEIELTAPRFWPLSFITLEDLPPREWRSGQVATALESKDFVLALPSGKAHCFGYEFTPERAGVYLFKHLRSGSFGPLGLLGIYRQQDLVSALVVRPLPPEHRLTVLSQEQELELQSARQRSHYSEDISHFREYQPGDNKRAIHWKNSAKRQKLIVAEAREEPFQQALVLVDTQQGQSPEEFQRVVTTTEKVCHALLEQNLELNCWAQPSAETLWQQWALSPPQRRLQGLRQWEGLSYWLATLMSDAELDLLSALRQYGVNPEEQLLVVISSQLSQPLLDWLLQGRGGSGLAPVLVYGPGENLSLAERKLLSLRPLEPTQI